MTIRLRTGLGIATAAVLGIGVTISVLAGGARSPRPGTHDIAAVPGAPSPAATPSTEQPAAPPATPPGSAPIRPGVERPAVTSTSSAPPSRRAAPAPRAAAGSLAQAWIAAGAKGIDPGATPAPGAVSGSAGPAPVRIEIPSLRVGAPVDPAGLNPDGTLAVPADFARTSFYTGRPSPGDPGPAVIIGHVDGRGGPAVFYRLRELQPGAEVVVRRADNSAVTFVVERSRQVPKNAFPTDEVYGPTPGPTLRLITCGGSFDRRSGHYRDNTIVFLRLKG